jgi:hypothetical protein
VGDLRKWLNGVSGRLFDGRSLLYLHLMFCNVSQVYLPSSQIFVLLIVFRRIVFRRIVFRRIVFRRIVFRRIVFRRIVFRRIVSTECYFHYWYNGKAIDLSEPPCPLFNVSSYMQSYYKYVNLELFGICPVKLTSSSESSSIKETRGSESSK